MGTCASHDEMLRLRKQKDALQSKASTDLPDEVPEQEMDLDRHRHIGALFFSSKGADKPKRGTGILISPNLVLTAASNIYDCEGKEPYGDFKFYPKQCGKLGVPCEVENHWLPEEFSSDSSTANNYGLLKLKECIESDTFVPLNKDPAKIKSRMIMALFGYPDL
jgi:hypothetical protein